MSDTDEFVRLGHYNWTGESDATLQDRAETILRLQGPEWLRRDVAWLYDPGRGVQPSLARATFVREMCDPDAPARGVMRL